MKFYLLIFALFVFFGSAMIPLDNKLDNYFSKKGYLMAEIDLDLRDKISQNSFFAVLGGYRSLLASLMSLQAITEWERTNWEAIDSIYQVVTRLQPNVIFYWRDAKRFLGDDAASYYKNVSKENELIRKYKEGIYVKKAIEYLDSGIKSTSPNYQLYFEKAMIYDIRLQDYLNSSINFQKASKMPDAPLYLKRRAVYSLYKVPGKEKECYKRFRDLFLEGRQNHLPSLLIAGYELEIILSIDYKDRVFSYEMIPEEFKADVLKPFFDLKKIIKSAKSSL